MNIEAILDYYMFNGKLVSTENPEGFKKATDPSIYEVIRVIDGVPLFKEEHLRRMRKSAELLGYNIEKSDQEISSEVDKLIRSNNCRNLNIKLVNSNLDKSKSTFLIYFMKSNYPEASVYQSGIHTILINSQRENPNVKKLNVELRKIANIRIKEEGAYEAIFVNEEGFITEGSRSNIFFVKDKKVYTAPSGKVLLGITRKKIIQGCNKLCIDVIEKNIHVDELGKLDGAFMTGTSVNVLPISTIDKKSYKSVANDTIKGISNEYINLVKEYIALRNDKEG